MHGPGPGEVALTRRRVLGFAGAATLAGAAALAGARPAAAAERSYTFDLLFDVPHSDNMQGLAYRRGSFYVGFDVGGGHGVIREYDREGATLKESAPLAVGHAAEISVRDRDGLLYVATGGGTNPTKVNVVDWSGEPEVVRTIDFGSLGNSGLVAVDNRRDGLLVHAGPGDQGPFVFAFTDLDGTVRSTFDLGYQGVPQGLEMARRQGPLLHQRHHHRAGPGRDDPRSDRHPADRGERGAGGRARRPRHPRLLRLQQAEPRVRDEARVPLTGQARGRVPSEPPVPAARHPLFPRTK
ncbi:hypothetical protein ACFQY7_08425 [Actinomadura luteofluorescens]|uniref:hypothetical protein n=1 Tax=Actinomadura luteofluorescens TaxID=46163 RepID=UPI00362BEC68